MVKNLIGTDHVDVSRIDTSTRNSEAGIRGKCFTLYAVCGKPEYSAPIDAAKEVIPTNKRVFIPCAFIDKTVERTRFVDMGEAEQSHNAFRVIPAEHANNG